MGAVKRFSGSTREGHRSAAADAQTMPVQHRTARAAKPGAIDGSPRMVAQREQLAFAFGPIVQREAVPDEEELQMKAPPGAAQRETGTGQAEAPPQGRFDGGAPAAASPAIPARPNRTGLPDPLKTGIESLSGLSMDHVKVHYDSVQPAQLNALAYAQGSDIHLAPGRARHLPHEAWHVVQQAQGRVRPTVQLKGGVAVNDDAGLEQEADVMGQQALATPAQRQVVRQGREPLQPEAVAVQLQGGYVGESDTEEDSEDAEKLQLPPGYEWPQLGGENSDSEDEPAGYLEAADQQDDSEESWGLPLPPRYSVPRLDGANAQDVESDDEAFGYIGAADLQDDSEETGGLPLPPGYSVPRLGGAHSARHRMGPDSPRPRRKGSGNRMARGRGRGGALDPEARRRLDGEQQQLRALAAALAGKDDPRRLPVEKASAGWALLGMGSHGRDIDERGSAQGRPVTYLEGDERAQKVARVVDGRLVDVSDQALEGPAPAPEDVPKKQPLMFSAKLQAAFVKALRERRLLGAADEIEKMDNQDRAVQKRYTDLRTMVPKPQRTQLFEGAKQETAALMASRLIYAMNAAGDFFVGESVNGVFHHSSFLASGAVASAGDIKVVGGEITAISNNSGHYKPGAAFLWQAVRQLELLGVDLSRVTVEVLNAGDIKADVFLKYFSPLAPVEDRRHLSFDPVVAAAAVKAVIEELRRGVGHE